MLLPNTIIGGTGRSGSTSVFRYLAAHPEVCGSSLKETQFFMRHRSGVSQDELDEYARYFSGCRDGQKIRLEATPHYLHLAEEIAPLIRTCLNNVKLIFILREPVSRLFTVYRNLRLHEPQAFGTWDFGHFIKQALDHKDRPDSASENPGERAASYMYTGCYVMHLKTYYGLFEPDDIQTVFFDELISNPRTLMKKMAKFLEIDDHFFDSYNFTQENRTRNFRFSAMHRLATRTNTTLEPLLNKFPWIRQRLRAAYNVLNEAKSETEQPNENDKRLLHDFYTPYNSQLHDLLSYLGHSHGMPDWLQSSARQRGRTMATNHATRSIHADI